MIPTVCGLSIGYHDSISVMQDRVLVVDPFMGTGSTFAAARSLGLPCVGGDIDPMALFATTLLLDKTKTGPDTRQTRNDIGCVDIFM